MLRLPSIRLGSVLGIPLELNASWFLVFALVGWAWSFDVYPTLFPGRAAWVDVASGLVTALLFFASIVAHELSHSVVARRADIPVQRVTLFMFGGVAQLSEEPRSARVEALMSLAGPAMSLLLASLAYGGYRLVVSLGGSGSLWSPLLMLAGVNLSVAVFNLAPGYPMDGGRVLHAFLWWASGDRRLATRLASVAGTVLGLGLAGAGVWVLLLGSLEGVWFVLLGLFLRALAVSAYRSQAARLDVGLTPVSDVMSSPAPTLSADATLSEVLRVLGPDATRHAAIVTEADGSPAGVVSFRGALDRLGAAGPSGSVTEALTTFEPQLLIDAGDSLDAAVRRFDSSAVDDLFVVDGGRVVGTASRSAVGARLVALAKPASAGPLRWLAPR